MVPLVKRQGYYTREEKKKGWIVAQPDQKVFLPVLRII
jgi:hypothetical protein